MNKFFTSDLAEVDPIVREAIDNEVRRQADGLEWIASENFVLTNRLSIFFGR